MPKEFTHWTISEKIFSNLNNSNLKNIIANNKNIYYIGAVILDAPVYGLFMKNASAFEESHNILHGKQTFNTFQPFERLIKQFTNRPPDNIIAFILGMINHIITDSEFHPLVNYFSGNYFDVTKPGYKKAKTMHHLFETYIDLYYFSPPRLFNNYSVYHLIKNMEIDKNLFLEICGLLFFNNSNFNKNEINTLLRHYMFFQYCFRQKYIGYLFKLFNKIVFDKYSMYVTLFYPNLTKINTDFFKNKITYKNPVTGKEIIESIDNIEDRTINKIISIYALIEKNLADENILNVLNYIKGPSLSSGLEDSPFNPDIFKYFDTSVKIDDLVFDKI